jgi:hypothetical protein
MKRMAVETYVVSVYRRSDEPGKEAAGLIERTGSAESQPFTSREELWTFLCGKGNSLPMKTARTVRVRREP